MTSDTLNDQELWDDTLFMTVLFLANMGRIEGNQAYIDEAQRQFLLHAKYLADPETGLWYHGWTFNGRHNFAEAFWGRGNCWDTIAIPEFIELLEFSKNHADPNPMDSDVEQIATGIEKLLNHPTLQQQMSLSALATVKDLTIEKRVRSILQFFQQCEPRINVNLEQGLM